MKVHHTFGGSLELKIVACRIERQGGSQRHSVIPLEKKTRKRFLLDFYCTRLVTFQTKTNLSVRTSKNYLDFSSLLPSFVYLGHIVRKTKKILFFQSFFCILFILPVIIPLLTQVGSISFDTILAPVFHKIARFGGYRYE